MEPLRHLPLAGAEFAQAAAGTIRLKLLKIGAVIAVSERRTKRASGVLRRQQLSGVQDELRNSRAYRFEWGCCFFFRFAASALSLRNGRERGQTSARKCTSVP